MAQSLEGGCEPRHGEVVSVKAMRQARCSSNCSTALPVSHDHRHALVLSIAPIPIAAFIENIFGSHRLKYGSLMSAAACMHWHMMFMSFASLVDKLLYPAAQSRFFA